MRRPVLRLIGVLLLPGLLLLGGCSITSLQLQDYAISTAISVISSIIVNGFAAATGT